MGTLYSTDRPLGNQVETVKQSLGQMDQLLGFLWPAGVVVGLLLLVGGIAAGQTPVEKLKTAGTGGLVIASSAVLFHFKRKITGYFLTVHERGVKFCAPSGSARFLFDEVAAFQCLHTGIKAAAGGAAGMVVSRADSGDSVTFTFGLRPQQPDQAPTQVQWTTVTQRKGDIPSIEKTLQSKLGHLPSPSKGMQGGLENVSKPRP